jgi:DNA-binding IclR family transcriptional regulator
VSSPEPDGVDNGLSSGSHRGVQRIAQILEAAAARPAGIRLVEIASLLDAPRSSVHSLLKGLVNVGYLEELEGRYCIGAGLHTLLAPNQTAWIVDLARNDVSRLSREIGETALLGTQVGDSIVYVLQVESNQSIRYTAKVGERRTLYPTSIGKLFVAAMTDDRLTRYLASRPDLDPAAVREEIAEVREVGVAYNRGETVVGVTAAAAPILDAKDALVAAISVVGPVYRMTDDLTRIGAEVSYVAQKISSRVRESQGR